MIVAEWIIAKDNPPKQGQKNVLCSGVDGGVYKPTSICINEEGEIYATVSGKKMWVYAYLVYPDAPKHKRTRKIHKEAERGNRAQRCGLDWPLNMLADVDRKYFRGCIFFNEMPENFNDNWEKCTGKLTEREKEFVEAYYREFKTYREIAGNYNLSRERCRQIIDKAIRKIRNTAIKECLLGKRNQYPEKEDAEALTKNSGILGQDIAFCDPELSVRAFNALKRYGVNTKRDLILITEEEIKT